MKVIEHHAAGDRIEANMDRISELPEDIIHNILSFLPLKQVVRTSVLSKTWLSVCSTNPYLDFDDTQLNYARYSYVEHKYRYPLLEFLEKTLKRYREQSTRIQKLSIRIRSYNCQWASLVNNSIETAFQNSAQILKLHFDDVCWASHYDNVCLVPPLFPTTSAAKSLEVLKLGGCGMVRYRFSNSMKFHSLKELSLKDVFIYEDTIQNLILCCPLIEKLCLKNCWVKSNSNLRVAAFPKLKMLKISESEGSGKDTFKIDASNLFSLQYNSFTVPSSSITGSPQQWNITIQVIKELRRDDDYIDPSWYCKLANFLNNLNEFGVLSLQFCYGATRRTRFDLDHFRQYPFPPVHEIQHLKIVTEFSPSCAGLVNGLLWSCHPKTLTIYLLYSSLSKIDLKTLRKMLRRREDPICCRNTHIRCWRHYLKDAEFDSFGGIKAEPGNLLDSLPCFPIIRWIKFRLKW